MKKSDRIDLLEAGVDQLRTELDAVRRRLTRLENPPEVTPGRSLGAIALDEIRDKRDALLETLGIRL